VADSAVQYGAKFDVKSVLPDPTTISRNLTKVANQAKESVRTYHERVRVIIIMIVKNNVHMLFILRKLIVLVLELRQIFGQTIIQKIRI